MREKRKKRKKWTLILSTLAFSLFCLNVFLLLFFGTPMKRPDIMDPNRTENRQEITDNTKKTAEDGTEDKPESFSDPSYDTVSEEGDDSLASTDTGLAGKPGVYVRDIPIALDEEMDKHLAEFRRKAKRLQQNYPDSFLISMPTTEKTVALTFDDGPDDSSTPQVIEILNSYRVPGTFFFIGQQMDRYPETVEAARTGSHVIANHSWSHIRPTDASMDAFLKEVQMTRDALSRYGTKTGLFRPPYGLVNEEQMPALIEAGFKTVAWSIDSMDWYFDDPDDIVACVVKNIHPGAIVLMHSSGGPANRQATIDALPVIIETLREQGYRFVALTE